MVDERPIRWGFLGAGGIAENVAQDIALTSGNVITAVAARDAGRAAGFAARHGIERSYGSYPELVADAEVDVVYIATTHPGHHDQALMAIAAGKAVLIEKPVCLTAPDACEVFTAAAAAGVFAMEAMWMRTNPLIRQAQQLIADGVIGEVRGLRHEFGIGLAYDPEHRLYDLDNGGGALLDLGIYPATFAYLFLGPPDTVITSGELAPTGADDTVTMEWLYDGAPRAQLWCSISTTAPNEAVILGSRGWITFGSPGFRPSQLRVQTADQDQVIADPLAGQGHGYGPQILEVARCLRAGLIESPLVTAADSIAVLTLLDRARADLGVKYA